MRHNLRKALSFQKLKGPDTNIDGLSLFAHGVPVPSKTIKSGSLASRNMAATSKSAKISRSFLRGSVSWNVPTLSIFLGRKNL
jgi:hypothetical protein